ncbi:MULTISPECIES: YonK family protein [unclassified Lysinibacillus]|uniref:YonK family protein n=1 Tax=unclassified Lysinibacillus TaxID=2636778 RepID=UPI003826DA53
MAKRTNSIKLKGKLDIDWTLGELIVTESVKDGDFKYSLNKLLEEFNGKNITLSIKEEDSIATISKFNVSSETDGEQEEDLFKED